MNRLREPSIDLILLLLQSKIVNLRPKPNLFHDARSATATIDGLKGARHSYPILWEIFPTQIL